MGLGIYIFKKNVKQPRIMLNIRIAEYFYFFAVVTAHECNEIRNRRQTIKII